MGLFQPAWMSKNKVRALKAVEKLTDESKLVQVAEAETYWDVRKAAVRKITDQSILTRFACDLRMQWMVRSVATKKLTDQTVLARLAYSDPEEVVRLTATEKLTDQAVLAQVVCRNPVKRILEAAMTRLTDQRALTKVALLAENIDNDARGAAYARLSDADAVDETLFSLLHGDSDEIPNNSGVQRVLDKFRGQLPRTAELLRTDEALRSRLNEIRFHERRHEDKPYGAQMNKNSTDCHGDYVPTHLDQIHYVDGYPYRDLLSKLPAYRPDAEEPPAEKQIVAPEPEGAHLRFWKNLQEK